MYKKALLSSLMYLALIFILSNEVFAQDFDWWIDLKKIKLLSSQKIDAENLFAKKSEKRLNDNDPYRLKQGILYIDIADGICDSNRVGDWKAPAGTVSSISFFLDDSQKVRFYEFIKHFNIDLNQFARRTAESKHSSGEIVYYQTRDNSLQFTIVDDIYLHSVMIDVPDNYNYPVCRLEK